MRPSQSEINKFKESLDPDEKIIFSQQETQVGMNGIVNTKMSQEQIDFELSLKKWTKKGDKEYEQHIEGWRPYYLHFIESENKWRLKQWGVEFSLLVFDELNEDTLINVFITCSTYAKEMPW